MNDEPGTRNKEQPSAGLTVYRPNQRHELGFIQTWQVMAKNIWGARELIWQLFKRDFLASYKKSFLGMTWIFITPILGIIPWVFLQRTGLLQPGNVKIHYVAYVLLGTSMWGLFMGFFLSASNTLKAGESLVMQVNFPHEALLFKATAEHLANFVIAFVLNIIVLLAFRVVPSWGVFLLPVVALPLFFLGAAIGLMTSMISVVAVDLSRGISVVMGLLMYATPVMYAGDVNSDLVRLVAKWNPLTYLVCSCRDVVVHGRLYGPPSAYFLCAAVSFFMFMIAWRLFYVSEHRIIERMV